MQDAFRILIVEDEPLVSLVMERMLSRAGYRVVARVPTGEEAIEAAAKETPDLLLMDIRLAGDLDGIDAAARIRESSPVPLVFMTGYQDEATRIRAAVLSPLAYIVKPVQLLDLEPLIGSLLASRAAG